MAGMQNPWRASPTAHGGHAECHGHMGAETLRTGAPAAAGVPAAGQPVAAAGQPAPAQTLLAKAAITQPAVPAGTPAVPGAPGVPGQAVPAQNQLAQAAATLPGMHQPAGASAAGLNNLAYMVQQRAQGELTYHYYQYVPGYGYVYEPGLKADGQKLAALLKDGRKTTKTCGCLQSWTHKGQACSDSCCNPDNDAGGPWCFVMDQACQGDTWGTCEPLPALAAAPAPSPAAAPAAPAPAPAAVAPAKMLAQMTSNMTEATAADDAAVEELAAVLGSDKIEVKEEEPKRNLRASFVQRKQGLEQVEGSPCDCGSD
ncbi:unnamed protein product [Symbiodinium natans]|uniref:Kringle domain-containing protein n=1 Tax=Symbiodinium natans TaxID=878477 RepID=A0A812SRS6_9DINO|nr:unnamed protein product [Symbiodinium natans]